MFYSIQHFEEISIKVFQKAVKQFHTDPTDMASFVSAVQDELTNLGLQILKEAIEQVDEAIRQSPERKDSWVVDRKLPKQLITSLGTVTFQKTLFKHKQTGERVFLLDNALGLEPHERLTEDTKVRILEETAESSYRKGGIAGSRDALSKETVKNIIHDLTFPEEAPARKLKQVEYLYLEADEDHTSLQFYDHRGDLECDANGRKMNSIITKLVYVHEGVRKTAPGSGRRELINPHYFCPINQHTNNHQFWDEVARYLDTHYDLSKVKRIYLNSDGGSWIKAGMHHIPGVQFVLDEFHLEKYLTKLTSHMKDSIDDAKQELRTVIREKNKTDFDEVVERLKLSLTSESRIQRIDEYAGYIKSNWAGAKRRMRHKDGVVGSSTEGHVSHVLASRMSSRPMGWSRLGAANMARLRAYTLNGGDVLTLVRLQKRKLPKAAGSDFEGFTCSNVIHMENEYQRHAHKYIDHWDGRISAEIQQKEWFKALNGYL